MAIEAVAYNSSPPERSAPSAHFLYHSEDANEGDEAVNSDSQRLVAQRLHTDFLLSGGHINASDLQDGLYYDEYSQSSSYFVVSTESRTAACRCISPLGIDEGIRWLPTLKYFTIFSQGEGSTAEDEASIESFLPTEVIEVSALIATPSKEIEKEKSDVLDATHLLCSTVLRDSLDKGHKTWVINVQENLRRSLNIFFGTEQVRRIGDPMFYYRPDAIPCMVNPEKAVQSMLSSTSRLRGYRLACLRATMSGVSERHLSHETIQLLRDVGIPISPALISLEGRADGIRTMGDLAAREIILP